MKNPWIIIGIIALLLFGGAFWYASISSEKNNEGIEIKQHIKGNVDAAVTLTEYSDLQCPACASFEPALNAILNEYGDSIRFEYKHFPLPIHPYAVQAAVAAEAAGQQDMFFEFHDLLFANQSEWSQSATPKTFFLKYAEELELDMDMFRRQMNSTLLRDHVQTQFAEARDMGLTGTPTFFLNGERMNIETFQSFTEQIAAAVNGESDTETVNEVESDIRFGL